MRKQILFLSLVALVLHLVWENMQAPLFEGYMSFGQHFFPCFMGAVGDVIITLSVYFIVALLKNDYHWVGILSRKDLIALAVIGFFIAIGIEWRALLFGRWEYAPSMPTLSYFLVGLSPILQMTLLTPLSFYMVQRMVKVKS